MAKADLITKVLSLRKSMNILNEKIEELQDIGISSIRDKDDDIYLDNYEVFFDLAKKRDAELYIVGEYLCFKVDGDIDVSIAADCDMISFFSSIDNKIKFKVV